MHAGSSQELDEEARSVGADSFSESQPPTAPENARVSWRWWPLACLAITGIVLLAFIGLSKDTTVPHFYRLPLYGRFAPTFSKLGWWLIPAGLVMAGIAWVATNTRVRAWLALSMIVLGGLLTSIAVNLLRGDRHALVNGVSTKKTINYTADLHFVNELGVRGFVSHYPALTTQFACYNNRTHPPGVEVMLWVFYKLTGPGHQFRFATALALLSVLVAVGAYALGRAYGGERAGRIAAALSVVTPALLMLAYTSVDVIFATFFTAAAALCVIGSQRRSLALMAGAGAVLGLTSFMTYATAFLALAMAVSIVIETRSLREIVRLGLATIGGGLLVLLILRLTLGFDLIRDYRTMGHGQGDYYPYFIAGHPAAMLISAGLPLAALGLAGLVVKVPGARRPVLAATLIAVMIIWGTLPRNITGLRQGEVERTWAFVYPLLAASAAPVIDRWTRSTRMRAAWAGAIVGGLVLISVAQAGVIQSFWDNLL